MHSYLTSARQLNELNAKVISSGLIDITDPDRLGRFFWQQAKLYNVGYLLFGKITGQYLDVGHPVTYPQELITERINPQRYGNSKLYTYEPDAQGNPSRLLDTTDSYDFQKEGWYTKGIQSNQPQWTSVWTPVYAWQSDIVNPLAIAVTSPVYDQNKQRIGAIAIEQRLSQISDYLRQLDVGAAATTFIVERDGLMIASSSAAPPYRQRNKRPERLPVQDSQDPLIQAAARQIMQEFGGFDKLDSPQRLTLRYQDRTQFVHLSPWQNERGLDWVVVTVIEKSSFMGQIHQNIRQTIVLCGLTLLGSVGLSLWLAQRIMQPIRRLTASAKRLPQAT